jgi:uncharacterized protein YlxP (DUF503 family)
MRIAAALIELQLLEADSLKDRRSVARAVVDRVRRRFNVAAVDLSDPDERRLACIGCVMIGRDPRQLRAAMEKLVRYVESLALAEVVADDVTVVRLDELAEEPADDDAGPAGGLDA